MTAVEPGEEGKQLWEAALNTFFCGDRELIDYVHQVAGLIAIGKVYLETLIIAYGEGRNGKSTFWNILARVLGTYSGNISAEALTANCNRNVRPELAEARGKRMLIAAELEEGTRLSTSIIKQLCSTDDVSAEKKYKDPFAYTPTHTLILYTNHLPKDADTWRHLIVIPFKAKIEGKRDIKNYTDYLYQNAGGAILSWTIEGAEEVIRNGFKLTREGTNDNWLAHFLDERCEIGKEAKVKSGELYAAYRAFCSGTCEHTRSTTDFYSALDNEGFKRKRTKTGSYVYGLELRKNTIH